MEIEEGVIRRGGRPRRITLSETLRVVFLLFLPCFELFSRLVLTLETSEMSAIFHGHKQNNSTSSPGLLG